MDQAAILLRQVGASCVCGLVWTIVALVSSIHAQDLTSEISVSSSTVITHRIKSSYQSEPVEIRVLGPSKLEPGAIAKAVYLLPVEANRESRYGDPIREIQTYGLHDKLGVFFIAPTFSALPWYADHPSDAGLRQESHLLKSVLPFVESKYPVGRTPEHRLLLGFSKSGWGAVCLLLRNPTVFSKAAAWDAPFMMQEIGKYGNGPIFGDQANFEAYRLTDLVRKQSAVLGPKARLFVTGYGNFRSEHEEFHAFLNEHRVPHIYIDEPPRKHDWHSGWVAESLHVMLKEQ